MNIVPVHSTVARHGEVIPPGATVRVVGTTHPLNAMAGARIDRKLDVGLTINEMLEEAIGDRARRAGSWIVQIDGNPIEERNWHRVRAKAGTVVTFIPRLQGGAAMRTVLGVVVAIGAILLAAPTGGLSLGLAGAIGVSANVASALIAGGVMPAGPIALNALFIEEHHHG